MPYKDKEKQRVKALENYYNNRERKLQYQREYDKKNKDKKNEYEREKRRGKLYNLKKSIQHYSQEYHYLLLLEKFGSCQFCGSKENLQIHHKKYTHEIGDCLLLCLDCHKKIHRK